MTSHVLFSIVSHLGRISVRIFLTVMGLQSISVTSSHSSLVLVSKPVTSHFSCLSDTPANCPISQSITQSTNYTPAFWVAENFITLFFKIRSGRGNQCSHLRSVSLSQCVNKSSSVWWWFDCRSCQTVN